MGSPDASQRAAAEQWFLDRGLPSVLRPGALARQLWTRSAPALAAFAVMMAFSIVIVLFTGKHTIDIEGRPTRTQWFVLAAAMLVLPSAGAVGWLVSRIHLAGSRMVASAVSVAIAVLGAIMGGPSSRIVVNLLVSGISIAVVLALTASGAGSILAWAVQMTASNLALMATLIARALPVVLLTVLVFFNGYVWLMAAIVSRPRLWLAIAFLVAIAEAFVASAPRNGCSRCCRRRASPRRMTSGWPTRRSRGSPAGRRATGYPAVNGGMWCSCSPCRKPCRSGSSQS